MIEQNKIKKTLSTLRLANLFGKLSESNFHAKALKSGNNSCVYVEVDGK